MLQGYMVTPRVGWVDVNDVVCREMDSGDQ